MLHLSENVARLLLLLGRQMLPGFHVAQNALLLLRRKTGKVAQALAQLLLPLRREAAEMRVALQGALLFRGWQIFVAAQPVASVAAPRPGMALPGMRRLRLLLVAAGVRVQ